MLIIIVNALQTEKKEYQKKAPQDVFFKKKKNMPHTELRKDAGDGVKRVLGKGKVSRRELKED